MSDPATIDSPPLRPIIIPTPSLPQARQKDSQTENSLKHYFANYQRLKKENTILNNQLEIINKQKEELHEKLEAMKVLFGKLRGNMNKRKSAIAEPRDKSNVNTPVLQPIAPRNMDRKVHFYSTQSLSILNSILLRNMSK